MGHVTGRMKRKSYLPGKEGHFDGEPEQNQEAQSGSSDLSCIDSKSWTYI